MLPPAASSALVAAMENVRAVYQRPRDPACPLVWLDEATKPLLKETRVPILMNQGCPKRVDDAYARNGTAKLVMMCAPLEGWRHLKVTDRHTALDYAHALQDLADVHFPRAKQITRVQANLNPHKQASLYAAFPAAEARPIVERCEGVDTPTHGSGLDRAESELGVLSSQCLDRRIPDQTTLSGEVAAWQASRNKHHSKADWQFTTADARSRLKHLYPTI